MELFLGYVGLLFILQDAASVVSSTVREDRLKGVELVLLFIEVFLIVFYSKDLAEGARVLTILP